MLAIVCLLIILSIFMIGSIMYLISKGRMFTELYHDILDWHIPNDEQFKFDGCIIHSHCKICGKEIMRDSQGNWF